jgi:hypothetical protein
MSDNDELAGSGAEPDECVVEQTDDGDEVWNPFEAEYEDLEMPATQKVMGEDGLPQIHAPVNSTDIPELSPTTLVCLPICTSFVVRDAWGVVTGTFKPEEVERTPDGRWRAAVFLEASHGQKLERPVEHYIEVFPIRPQCKHYVNQASQLDCNPEHKQFYRLCALRRTTEGAMMSLNDRGFWACTGREPRDIESEKLLSDFDAMKMRQGKDRTYVSMFKIAPGTPEAEAIAAAAGGIFSGNQE